MLIVFTFSNPSAVGTRLYTSLVFTACWNYALVMHYAWEYNRSIIRIIMFTFEEFLHTWILNVF